jgi:7,8-dihydro-6-hydroxymethylpterin-pyrophosphokinase
VRWGPRLIDIDVLLYDDLVSADADLVLPHPRMMDRAFVLQPLVDLDPGLRDPVSGVTLAEHLAEGTFEAVQRRFDGIDLLPEPVG